MHNNTIVVGQFFARVSEIRQVTVSISISFFLCESYRLVESSKADHVFLFCLDGGTSLQRCSKFSCECQFCWQTLQNTSLEERAREREKKRQEGGGSGGWERVREREKWCWWWWGATAMHACVCIRMCACEHMHILIQTHTP